MSTVNGYNFVSIIDTTEDILAKYRRKPGTTSSLSSDQNVESTNPVKHKQPIDERLKIDPSNIETSYAFIDAKRKLRMVLSTADLQYGPWMPNSSFGKVFHNKLFPDVKVTATFLCINVNILVIEISELNIVACFSMLYTNRHKII